MHVQPTATNCAIAWCYFNFHQRAVNAGTDTCNGDTEQSDGRRLPVEVHPSPSCGATRRFAGFKCFSLHVVLESHLRLGLN